MWRRCSCFKALEAAVLVSSVESSRCALPRPKIAKPSRCACAGELHNFDPVLRVDLEQAGRCQGWEVHTVASNLGVRTHSACKQQAMLLAHIWAWKVAGPRRVPQGAVKKDFLRFAVGCRCKSGCLG